ncbi:MAG: PAS domain S-box protein [Polyangia bacterium]
MPRDSRKTKAQLLEDIRLLRARVAELEAAEVEAEVPESAEVYRTLVEAAPDGILLLDWGGYILSANRSAAALAGFQDPKDLLGRNCFDFVPQKMRRHFANRLRLIAQNSKTEPVAHQLVRPDGSVLDVESSGLVIREEDGTPRAMVAMLRDVSDRRRAEREADLIRLAVDAAGDPLSLVDEDGRFLFVNEAACRSTGYTREQHDDLRICDINPELTPEKWRGFMAEVARRGRVKRLTLHRARDGSEAEVELIATHVELDEGDAVCTIVRPARRAFEQE